MTILLVEDELSLASFIQKGLAAEGYDSKVAYGQLLVVRNIERGGQPA